MLEKNKDYMIHIHLQDSKVDVNTIYTKHNNFNNLCFHINKHLLDNFTIEDTFKNSQYNVIKKFLGEVYQKEDPTKEDIIVCYIHHRLHNILFNSGKNNLEIDFSRIVTKTLETTNHSLYKQLKKIVKSTISHCQTEHGTKHGAENTILQTLKDFGYSEDGLNGLSNDKLKLKLKHHKLNQILLSFNLFGNEDSSLQDKKNLIETYKQEEEKTNNNKEINIGNKIIIKENKKKPKKPLLKREKINLSKIHQYIDENNE